MTTRCTSCNGIITKTDSECYSCGERVPGASGLGNALLRFFAKSPPPSVKGSSIVKDRVLETRKGMSP